MNVALSKARLHMMGWGWGGGSPPSVWLKPRERKKVRHTFYQVAADFSFHRPKGQEPVPVSARPLLRLPLKDPAEGAARMTT